MSKHTINIRYSLEQSFDGITWHHYTDVDDLEMASRIMDTHGPAATGWLRIIETIRREVNDCEREGG